MDFDEVELKMLKALEAMDSKLVNIRAGRANPGMLHGINVVYYGTPTALNTIANITIPEAKQITIKPFDRNTLKDIAKAINEANLGLTPINNGEVIILTIPDLTEEKRKEYVKQAKLIAEETKIALRNIRQDANNAIKKAELPEDEEKGKEADIQDLIIRYNQSVDDKNKAKELELMSV